MVNNSSQGDHIIIISPQIALKPQIQPRIFNPVLISPQVEEVKKMLNREDFMSLPKTPEALPKTPNSLPKVLEAPVPKVPKITQRK
jgi:hypothetical protein